MAQKTINDTLSDNIYILHKGLLAEYMSSNWTATLKGKVSRVGICMYWFLWASQIIQDGKLLILLMSTQGLVPGWPFRADQAYTKSISVIKS